MLEGGRDSNEAFRPALLIEIGARHTARCRYSPDDVVNWLTRRGYTMHVYYGTVWKSAIPPAW